MNIFVKTVSGEEYEVGGIEEIMLDESADAACAALTFSFVTEKSAGEIDRVFAYENGELIFNGFCDRQKEKYLSSKTRCFVYARSGAALLLDNEAKPFSYQNATASVLFDAYARELGFINKLPDISCEALYEVQKGSSCFGAINRFVSLVNGGRISVTPMNEIVLPEGGKRIDANALDIIEAVAAVNRSEPLSSIAFKRGAGEKNYGKTAHARISDGLGIRRLKLVNLESLPEWQRDFTVVRTLAASYEKYKTLELTVSGYARYALFSKMHYAANGDDGDYILYGKRYCLDKSGEKTKLFFRKSIDIKEITYVD